MFEYFDWRGDAMLVQEQGDISWTEKTSNETFSSALDIIVNHIVSVHKLKQMDTVSYGSLYNAICKKLKCVWN